MKYTLITLAALSGTVFGQNLVVNGDFSDTSGMTPYPMWFEGVPYAWSTSGPDIAVTSTAWAGNPSFFSSNYISVKRDGAPVTLSQEISGLTSGQQYTLSYDWGNASDKPYDMTISMGDQSAHHAGTGFANATNESFVFTASAATETLSIAYTPNGYTPTGFNSTNFTVTPVNPVPEPSSTALLGLGGLALILRRRK